MSNFPKPLNTWHEEPVEIATMEPIINKAGRVVGMKQGTRTVSQRVKYSELSNPQKITCPDREHCWTIPDKHNHIAVCMQCPKRQFIRAVFEKVVDGKILDRDTSLHLA